MARKPHKQKYVNAVGLTQYKPSIEFVMAMSDNEGFCVACGKTQLGVEPDGWRVPCQSCDKHKVYGREIFILESHHF